ncbi:8820_t:CDS:2, partial [Entrophospora sp. SA101]
IDELVSDFYIFYSDKVIDPLSPQDLGFLIRMFCVKLLHRRVGDRIHGNLTLALCVYSIKLSVKDLDYKTLGEQLDPNKDIVAINSNFIHKTYEGFENFITQSKKLTAKKKKLMTIPTFKEQKKVDLQVFGVIDEDYQSGEIAYHMILPSNLLIDISKLDSILAGDLYPPPFKIIFRADAIESIRKLSIIFESNGKKTRVIIWPTSNLFVIVPTHDPPQPKTPGRKG